MNKLKRIPESELTEEDYKNGVIDVTLLSDKCSHYVKIVDDEIDLLSVEDCLKLLEADKKCN